MRYDSSVELSEILRTKNFFCLTFTTLQLFHYFLSSFYTPLESHEHQQEFESSELMQN